MHNAKWTQLKLVENTHFSRHEPFQHKALYGNEAFQYNWKGLVPQSGCTFTGSSTSSETSGSHHCKRGMYNATPSIKRQLAASVLKLFLTLFLSGHTCTYSSYLYIHVRDDPVL